jgi:O-antigen ligase
VSALTTRVRTDPAASVGPLVWAGAAVAMGVGIGLGAAADAAVLAAGLVLLPLLAALFLQPAWLPALLIVTVFTEAVTVGGLTVSRLAGPLAFVVLLVHAGALRGRPFPDRRILVAAGAYAAWAVASSLWTVNASGSGTGFALGSMGLSGVYLAATALLLRTERDVTRLVQVMFAVSVAMALVAIRDYLAGAERAVGFSGDANFFASLQVVVIPLAAVLAGQARTAPARLAYLAGLILIVGSVFTSLSRGGILALAGVFLLLSLQPAQGFFRTRARKTAFIVAVSIGAAGLLTVSYGALSARAASLFTTADGGSGRTNLWRAAITGWKQEPVKGLGFGAFESQSNELLRRTPGVDFSAYRLRETGQVVHNAYLESLVELGVVGLALFLALLAAALASLRRTARRAMAAGQPHLSAVSRALFVAMLGFAFTSIFLSTETDRTLWMLLGFALALPRIVASKESPTR